MSTARQRLIAFVSAHPLCTCVLAGAVARLSAALIGFGFHARDDYFHVLMPAMRWMADPSFDWDASSLPGAGIRSHLVPRLCWLCLRGFAALGITEPETILRGLHCVVGTYSLLVIPALYYAGKALLSERGAWVCALLGALHFVMPYAGTRLLIESMAMPPLAFGLYLLTSSRARRVFLGGAVIGLACWLRYQVAIAAIGFAFAVGVRAYKQGGARRLAHELTAFAGGGVVALIVQGIFDLLTTGVFLGPLVANIAVNMEPPSRLTKSSFSSYLAMWLVLTVPPATLVLVPAMIRAARRLALVTWPFALFVLVHSAIPHKEERFMLPVLPLFLVLLAATPQALQDADGGMWRRLINLWPTTKTFLIAIHAALLLLAVSAQSQAALRESMVVLRHDKGAKAVISLGPEVHDFFLARPTLPLRHRGKPDAKWVTFFISDLQANHRVSPNRFLGFSADRAHIETILSAHGFMCDEPVLVLGWWLDRVIYRINPTHNRRRSSVLIWRCEQPAFASTGSRSI